MRIQNRARAYQCTILARDQIRTPGHDRRPGRGPQGHDGALTCDRPPTLICTVGTSLFVPNLKGLSPDDPDPTRRRLANAYAAGDRDAIASALADAGPARNASAAPRSTR